MVGSSRETGQRYLDYEGLCIGLRPDVYEPSDDSFLLAATLRAKTFQGARVLDIGTGTGIVGLSAARAGAWVVGSDRTAAASLLARENAGRNALGGRFHAVRTDGGTALRGPFDIVSCNPPYLPENPEEDRGDDLQHAFTAGPTGAEFAERVLDDAKRLLRPNGLLLLVTSSRGNEEAVLRRAATHGFAADAVASRSFFFEKLTVWAFLPERDSSVHHST
jgi:release factor glutamine methyltransferase